MDFKIGARQKLTLQPYYYCAINNTTSVILTHIFSSPPTGNGYIEGGELDGFLREFVTSVNAEDVGPEVSI